MVLRFPFFGVPVSIHLSFGLVVLFGLGSYRGWDLAAWTGAVFVAVLLHESGHAFTAKRFGAALGLNKVKTISKPFQLQELTEALT